MPLLAILGGILVVVGLLGLVNVIALSTIVSVCLMAVGVVLVILDPSVRNRF